MTEKQEIKTSRELITELLGRLHPDADLNDEETFFGLIYDDYDDYAQMIVSREADIERAEAQGEIKGRNAKIEELMQQQPESDGVPDLGGANTVYHRTSTSIFSIARDAYAM